MARRIFAVIGLGQLGEHVARRLSGAGEEVIAIDMDMERVEALKDVVARSARADCSSEEAMRAMGLQEAEVAVVALGEKDFESAVLGTAVLKGLGVGTIVARSSSLQRGKILTLAGASRVIYPEAEMGAQLAQQLLHSSLRTSVHLPNGYTLGEVMAPPVVNGRTLSELTLPKHYGLSVITVIRDGKPLEVTPELALMTADGVLVVGRNEQVSRLAAQWQVA